MYTLLRWLLQSKVAREADHSRTAEVKNERSYTSTFWRPTSRAQEQRLWSSSSGIA
jgi:hypothetical protein